MSAMTSTTARSSIATTETARIIPFRKPSPAHAPLAADAALIARIKAGDEAACETLVREYRGRLLAVARRLLRSEDDAADAVQDAFLAAFRSLATFEGGAALSTWLHRIVFNASLMKLRERRRRSEVSMDELLPSCEISAQNGLGRRAPFASRAELLERQETVQLVRQKIAALPEAYRSVLVLRDLEEWSTDETARFLGVNKGAVKTRLHRARAALRSLLEPALA